jgi:phage terminase large subunit-like protein
VHSSKRALSLSGFGLDVSALEKLSGKDRELAEQELLALEEALRRNPLLGYAPHAKQIEFQSGPWPALRAFFGGNRSGKTTAVVIDSIIQAVDPEFVPEHLQGFKRWAKDGESFYCRFVTPDLTNTLEGVVLQKLRDWTPREQLRGGNFDRAWDKQLRILRFKNGNWFQFFSNDQDRDKFGGAALHRVVYDEEPRSDIRQECLMRLIDYGGEELFAMTPLSGMSWLYDEVYEPWERNELTDGRVVVVDMDDNPHLDQVAKTRVLSGLTAEEREARKSGRFVHFAGLVYPAFSNRVDGGSVIPTPPDPREGIPSGAEVFAGIDPGMRHLAAVVFAYLDLDDTMVVFEEVAIQGKTVSQVCKAIHAVCFKWGVQPKWYVIDPAARNKNSQTGRSDQQEFADHGVFTIPGQNSVSAGINRVKERLDAGKLQVMAHCTELRGEFKRYRWMSQGRGEQDAKEAPVKRDDHLLDALRYVVMQRPLTPHRQPPIESLTLKDRLLRHSLERLRIPRVPEHPSGSGIFS